MAGVAVPMIQEQIKTAVRFLAGLAIGVLASSFVLGLCILVVGSALHALLPLSIRVGLLAVLCAVMGTADIFNRTPHVWRQVPQALVRRLSPGFLGVAWGADLGLLFTTQKAASLIWAAIGGALLLYPQDGIALLLIIGLLNSATIVLRSSWIKGERLSHGTRRDRRWLRRLRTASGSLLLAACAFTVVDTFLA